MEDEVMSITSSVDYFGPLYKYVVDESITDIDYNGRELWLSDTDSNRYVVATEEITDEFVEQFCKRVANTVSQPFHKLSPILEAETDTLRITIVHESVAVSGKSICIRKSMPFVRLTEENMIETGYCSEEIINFLRSCVLARMNLVFGGEPGVGKTELAKFCSQYIDGRERVITIEDNPEWHYTSINPGKDCIELKINQNMDYTKAIKTCMRLNPKWMFLSEVRSAEVKYLIEGFSTGVRGFTTIHTDDVRNIPDRMLNMASDDRNERRMENDIYSFVDVGILIKRREVLGSNGVRTVVRYIDQIGLFYRENKENHVEMIVEDGEVVNRVIPEAILSKFYDAGIYNSFVNDAEERMQLSENIAISTEQEERKEEVQHILEGMSERLVQRLSKGGTYRGERASIG